MRFWAHFAVLAASACLLILVGGCSIDEAAKGAAAGGKAARDSLKSPAGDLVPEPVKSAALATAVLVEALALAWLNRGKRQLEGQLLEAGGQTLDYRNTLKAVVRGVEASPDEHAGKVKENIETAMKASLMFDRGNAIVDELKA